MTTRVFACLSAPIQISKKLSTNITDIMCEMRGHLPMENEIEFCGGCRFALVTLWL